MSILKQSALRLFVTVLLVTFTHTTKASGFVIVANKAGAPTRVTKKELKDIYLGHKVYWNGGKKIEASRLADESKITAEFVSDVLGETIDYFLSFWRRKLFTGRGLPPRRFESEAELIEFVSKTDNSIGVVSKETAENMKNPNLIVLEVE